MNAQTTHRISRSLGALALAMLFWIYLQAQVLMYALEISVVKAQKDWPKRLFS